MLQAADRGQDGRLTWDDWRAMLFHELPQEAAWVDGHAPDAVPQFAEDILLDAFDAHDLDNDGQLAITELAAVLSDAHRRHAEKKTWAG